MEQRYNFRAVTDKDGIGRLNLPAGIGTVTVEAQGNEPARRVLQVTDDDQEITMTLRPITKGFISRENERLRGLIRFSTNHHQITSCAKENEHLIDLASDGIKRDATRRFSKTSKLAQRRIEELRRLESSLSISIKQDGVEFSKSERKEPLHFK